MPLPILDLSLSQDPEKKGPLLDSLRDALFNVGFLYVRNHGVSQETIDALTKRIPGLFDLPEAEKAKLSKINSPHFLGYSGYADEETQGRRDLREQFDFATEVPVVYDTQTDAHLSGRDFSKLYWRLRGPNQWPSEDAMPGFWKALLAYHDALSDLSHRFVHLVEEAFGIPVGTFDRFFHDPSSVRADKSNLIPNGSHPVSDSFLVPQHRLKLVKYRVADTEGEGETQGVGPHKDSSGWLTFLYQVDEQPGLEVLGSNGAWIPATLIPGTFVVNFGNAFEAATEGAVRATIHRVKVPTQRDRYSIPFFMGLPLDLKLSDIRAAIPRSVRSMRRERDSKAAVEETISSFLDPRWDNLGESMLRKWIRSHRDVALRWYGLKVVDYYTQ